MFSYSYNTSASISSGPNQGYQFVTSFSDASTYIYELNPGLTDSSDPFYVHQYGKCGFPSVAQIVSAVQTHEYSGNPSHYSEVAVALAGNNPGTVAEASIAVPGTTQDSFETTLKGNVEGAYNAAAQAGVPEPPTNLPANINYYPYQPLPSGCK